MFESERKFAEFLTKNKKTYVYQPVAFKLKNTTYRTDFYCLEDNTYYEVVGSRQAFHSNKNKINEFIELYPDLNFKVVIPNGKIYRSFYRKTAIKNFKIYMKENQFVCKKTAIKNLRAYMEKTELTIGPMAKIIGCGSRQISRWLKGEAMPSSVYAKMIDKAINRLQAKRAKG